MAVVFTAKEHWFLGRIGLEIPLQVFPTFQDFTVKGEDSSVSTNEIWAAIWGMGMI